MDGLEILFFINKLRKQVSKIIRLPKHPARCLGFGEDDIHCSGELFANSKTACLSLSPLKKG